MDERKTCVVITGTNAVGKSTVARLIAGRFGGFLETNGRITFCADRRVCFAGPYKSGSKYGGVDHLRDASGRSCTSLLESAVAEGLQEAEVVFCEGSFLNSFGLNVTRALFVAERQLVVSLWAPFSVIRRRLVARSGERDRAYDLMEKKQLVAMRAAQKYRSIGVETLQYDTSALSPEQVADGILAKLGFEPARAYADDSNAYQDT